MSNTAYTFQVIEYFSMVCQYSLMVCITVQNFSYQYMCLILVFILWKIKYFSYPGRIFNLCFDLISKQIENSLQTEAFVNIRTASTSQINFLITWIVLYLNI